MCVYTYTFIPVFMFMKMHTKQTILFPSLKKNVLQKIQYCQIVIWKKNILKK